MAEYFLVSQLLASVALVAEILAVQLKNKQHLLALLSASCFFNGLHFLLLDQLTAGYIFLFSSVRFLVAIRWKSQWLAAVSLLVSLFIVIYHYAGFLSILGFIGTVFITIGSFSKNDKVLRIMMIIGSIIWLSHNYILWTPVGILVEAVFTGSSLLGYYRYYVGPQAKLTAQSQSV